MSFSRKTSHTYNTSEIPVIAQNLEGPAIFSSSSHSHQRTDEYSFATATESHSESRTESNTQSRSHSQSYTSHNSNVEANKTTNEDDDEGWGVFDTTPLLSSEHTAISVPFLDNGTIQKTHSHDHDEINAEDEHDVHGDGDEDATAKSPATRTFAIIFMVTFVTGISSVLNGALLIAIPAIVDEYHYGPGLELWPVSIFSLTSGCTLLISGAVADVVGSTRVFTVGCILQTVMTALAGHAPDGTQFLVYRAIAGVASSFCLPSAVAIVDHAFPSGRSRNWAFSFMGAGQPLGWALGLLLSGILLKTIGWRWGFYIAAIGNGAVLIFSMFVLNSLDQIRPKFSWRNLLFHIDWVGAIFASTSLGLLFYILTIVTNDPNAIHTPENATILAIGVILIPVFVFWVSYQERNSRPCLIPNSVWRNKVFSGICLNVFLAWGGFSAFELVLNFIFQRVQHDSGLEASIKFLPQPLSGGFIFASVGFFLHRVRADHLMLGALTAAALAQLLAANIDPHLPYWAIAFPALLLSPIGADVLFTVSNLLITSVFSAEKKALAGGIYNTVARFGNSVGIALAAMVAQYVTDRYQQTHHPLAGDEEKALLVGYKAALWLCFAMTTATLFVTLLTLRGVGKIGR